MTQFQYVAGNSNNPLMLPKSHQTSISATSTVQFKYLVKWIVIAGLLSGCTTGAEKKTSLIDVATIKQIDFKINSSKQPSIKLGDDLQARIVKNLSDWGYPMKTLPGQDISHLLTADIGLIEHTATPTGFSFSSGNSDPRALDFQKTNVMPIRCTLSSLTTPGKSADLELGFAVDSPDTGKLKMSEKEWMDHIGTVCFNLLSELDWPDKQTQPTTNKPGWIPEVRIETVPASTEPGNTATQSEKNTIIRESTDRKQIIIHNQGSPLILHLGHER